MEILTRENLLEQLKDMIALLKKCPKDMYFHAMIEFSGLDPKFMELARQYTIKKGLEAQQKKKKLHHQSQQNDAGNI